jgi:DNA-binding Lrp family transcriptional regulator
MRKSTDCILETLQGCPSGLTAKEVADRLGAARNNIGSRLSKLAAYGIIQKTRGRISDEASLCAIYYPLTTPSLRNKSLPRAR